MRKIMITGGFGFIGSNLTRYWLHKYPEDQVICLDSLTYAAREKWVYDYLHQIGGNLRLPYPVSGHRFEHIYCDIKNRFEVRKAIRTISPTHIIHLAAESHVCRSIDGPKDFIDSNILGTFNLLEAFRNLWQNDPDNHRFHHVSTDEVFGQLGLEEDRQFNEETKYAPTSPYAASKAASDYLVTSWSHTYGINTVITNCSNNFGPNQHDEKLVPKAIQSFIRGQDMTLYGSGEQVRDWLYVMDHCSAIDHAFHKGKWGESYCVGGRTEISNRQMVNIIKESVERVLDRKVTSNIVHTDDRPTDDMRYAVDCTKMESLGWHSNPEMFQEKLDNTVSWYAQRLMGVTK